MRLFYFIIDAACLNAFVVWNLKNPQWKNHKFSTRLDKRRLFLTEVADKLVEPLITQRASDPSISHQPPVAKAMLAIGVQPAPSRCATNPAKKRGRCHSCPRKYDKKCEHKCTKCNSFVCGKHAVKNTCIFLLILPTSPLCRCRMIVQ